MRASLFLICALCAAAGSAQPSTTELQAIPDGRAVDTVTQADEVALKADASRRMTVPVTVSGAGPFRFMVDTGANHTAISRQLAASLGLSTREGARLHSATGVSIVPTATVSGLQLGARTLQIDRAPLLEASNMGADGILGTDSLRSQRVIFDFKAGNMTVVPAGGPQWRSSPDEIVVRGKLKRGRLILTEAIADGAKATVILDTGSQGTIGNAALRKRLLGSKRINPGSQVVVQSVTGGTLLAESVFVKRLEIGGVELRDFEILFAPAHTFKQLGYDNRPALLLGMDAMRAFDRVSIDFAQKKLRLLLREHGSLQPVQLAMR